MTRLIPYHNNIVVEEFELGEVSKGGLLLPKVGKASTPYRYAKVVEVGPGRYGMDGALLPICSKVGDVIAFAKNQGVEFPLDGDDGKEKVYRLLNEQFILGKVEGLPQQSKLTDLDGRLIMMQPGSRAISDGALAQADAIAKARHSGFIDTEGGTIELMESMDRAEQEAD